MSLALDDCRCKTCLRSAPIPGETGRRTCRAKSVTKTPWGEKYFPDVNIDLWCCEGLWLDSDRIRDWEDVLVLHHSK